MNGSCLCGQVQFRVTPPLRDVLVCHCTQCRKTSGHAWAASAVPFERFSFLVDDGLEWFRASPAALRGFCTGCGSTLFWKPEGEPRISFAAGALDGATGLQIASHWHQAYAGDYYDPEGGPPPPATKAETLHGSCLCGANRFTLPGPMGAVTACHCSQCRKSSGHYAASFDVDEAAIDWQAKSVTEFTTAGGAARGFCPTCSASLYFRAADGAFSVEAGVIDNPTGGQLAQHIHVADKGDYYALTDGLLQKAQG